MSYPRQFGVDLNVAY